MPSRTIIVVITAITTITITLSSLFGNRSPVLQAS
jgi:hypothetical protein